jgi:hypothetical protein
VSRLRGSGIEIGAGANPLPTPLNCRERYIDVYDESELTSHSYTGQKREASIYSDLMPSAALRRWRPGGSSQQADLAHVMSD